MSRMSTGSSQKKVVKPSSAKVLTARKKTSYAHTPAGADVDRYQMIAIAAYYRAEHRGFMGGNPVEDWLAAEAEIDRQYH